MESNPNVHGFSSEFHSRKKKKNDCINLKSTVQIPESSHFQILCRGDRFRSGIICGTFVVHGFSSEFHSHKKNHCINLKSTVQIPESSHFHILCRGDHFRSGIICGTIWGSFPVLGSFVLQFGDQITDILFCGRRGGLMVSALVSGSSGPGSSPGRGHCVVFLGKTLYSHSASLSTQVYKWVPANLMLGVTLRWTSIPSRGE